MKKIILFFLVFLFANSAYAEIDLDSYSFDQLASLRDQIMVEMMTRGEWQEVVVPAGTYQVGKHIPSGHWQITCKPDGYCYVTIGSTLEDNGKEIVYGSAGYYHATLAGAYSSVSDRAPSTVDLILKDGMYVYIERSSVTFTPYSGIPDLGFSFN